MINPSDVLYERFIADWARVLMTVPQVDSVFYIGTSVWYGADGYSHLLPNFVVLTTDPFWEEYRGKTDPMGQANHMIAAEANEQAMRDFCAKWRDNQWGPRPHDGTSFGGALWADQFKDGSVVRIIEAPALIDWAGPEYMHLIDDGVSYRYINQGDLRFYDPEQDMLMPTESYHSDDRMLQMLGRIGLNASTS